VVEERATGTRLEALIVSSPSHGHLTPLLVVAKHLVGRGHRVRFITGTRFADRVRASGAEFLPLTGEADFDLDDPYARHPEGKDKRGIDLLRFNIEHFFIRPVPDQADAIDAALADAPVDVVLADALYLGAAALLARPRAERPAMISLSVVPLALLDPDVPPMGFGLQPMRGPIGRLRNRLLQTIALRMFRPIFASLRTSLRDRGIEAEPGFDWLSAADLVVQCTVPEFEYPRAHPVPNLRFIGPVARGAVSELPLPDWWSQLDDGRPVVHVTQGTVANKDLTELLLPTLRALANEDVHVVAATGGRPLDSLPADLPANALVAEYLPYDRLLPRTSAYVTNGGYGGVHVALEHGVPMVVAGRTEDKPEVAARVAWSGAGIDLHTDRPSERSIRDAVRKLLDDERYRVAAARLQTAIAASPGLSGVDDAIAEVLA
jgi:MGT family glycosyltransferase